MQYPWKSCLDIGCGPTPYIEGAKTCDLSHKADFHGDYLDFTFGDCFDAIWCSHTLEHQRNPGLFLEKIRHDVKPGGVVAITVPPYRAEVAGGHIHLGNEFHLIYNMVLAGFDCSKARVNLYGYNISVLVERVDAELPELLMDQGDIKKLAPFFPWKLKEGQDGRLGPVNW